MGQPHKHAELIKAWADDPSLTIQVKAPEVGRLHTEWMTLSKTETPEWHEFLQYRIKPETIKYRNALMQGSGGSYWINSAITKNEQCQIETSKAFIKWINNWQEIEL